MSNEESSTRTLLGKVLSNKMQKTIVVVVERTVKHPKYNKIIRKRSKFHVHDENQICQIGNTVRIRECRPMSKLKSWMLVDVVS
ncbi:MAG: 30S ribosomal protein S17 [Legionellaceae bacterium]